jgi:hypothetical protein
MGKSTGAREDGTLRKLLLPTVAGVAGSALAVVLTKKPKQLADLVPKQLGDAVPNVRDAMPQLSGGVGEITDDLRGRLDSVLGKGDDGDGELQGFEEQTPRQLDTAKFEQRRAARRERREQRRRAA